MRRRGHHICEFERVVCLTGCYQAGDVRNISHEKGAHFVTDLSEPSIVKVAGVRGKPSNDHVWFEIPCLFLQQIIVNELGVRTQTILLCFPE